MKRIEAVEFLKGFSIFTVVIFHLFQIVQLPMLIENGIYFGGAGVHLFIFISGLGLYLSYQHKPVAFSAFFKKRFGNVYLPYILIILLTALITLKIPIAISSLYALLGHVFLYKMFDSTIIGSYLYPCWFISTILQFYLVFYLLAYLKKKISNTWFIVIGFVLSNLWSVAVVLLHKYEHKAWESFFLQYLWEFMLGMVAAELIYHKKLKVNISNIYYLLAGLAFVGLDAFLINQFGDIGKMFNDVPAALGYSFLALFLYNLNNRYINGFFKYTGSISYSLYLVHFLVLLLVEYAFRISNLIIPIYGLPVIVLLSYAAAHYYNKVTLLLPKFKA